MTTIIKPNITLESLGFNMVPQAPSKAWVRQKSIWLGESKVGKTKFWAQGDKTFFFRTEAGHNHVQTIGADCRDLSDVLAWKSKLMQAKAAGIMPFDTIVIDTGDRLLDYITDDVIAWAKERYPKNDINSIGEIPEGVGWFQLKTRTNMILKQLEELGCHIVIIFHVAQDQREDVGGKKYVKDTINVGGKSGKAILAWADHIMHVRATYVGETLVRKVVCRGSKVLEAGTRCETIPPELMWTADDKKNYEEFRKLFD